VIHYSILKHIQSKLQLPWGIRMVCDEQLDSISEAIITAPATRKARGILGACEGWSNDYEVRISIREKLEIIHNVVNTSTPFGQRLYFDLADPTTIEILDGLLTDLNKINDPGDIS
jgi:hypothetical protein